MIGPAPAPSAYDRYRKEVQAEEERFRSNSSDYVRFDPNPAGCPEWCDSIGHCTRTGPHYTHEARGGAGNILGRWRVRRQLEKVDPTIQLPE